MTSRSTGDQAGARAGVTLCQSLISSSLSVHLSLRMNRVPLYNYKKSAAQTTKPGSGDGRIIRIINAMDDSIRERVLLNLKTSQAFEDVVADLGQVRNANCSVFSV